MAHCRLLIKSECMNVRINEWKSSIYRFNYVQFLRHFLADAIRISAVSAPPFSVKSNHSEPNPGCEIMVLLHLPEAGALKVVWFPSCVIPFFPPVLAQLWNWNFALILGLVVCRITYLVFQIVDLAKFWLALFLDLDINCFHIDII